MITAKEAREMQGELIWSEIEDKELSDIQSELIKMVRSNCSYMFIPQDTSGLVIEKLKDLGYVYKKVRIGCDSDGESIYHTTIWW